MAHQDDWNQICQYCVDDNVFEVTTEDQIPRDANGELLLVGAFGVSKPTRLLDGREVLRMVINAIPSNLVQLMIMGDLGMFPVDPPWPTLILGLGEGLLWDSEDVKSCFTIYRMIPEWRRYFTLSKQAMVNGVWCWVLVAVLPMGWLSAVGVAQHLFRRVLSSPLAGSALLPHQRELRRDKPFPACEGGAGPRWWWSIYIDDFDRGQVWPLDVISALENDAQTVPPADVLADVWATMDRFGLPREMKTSKANQVWFASRGAFVDGRLGYARASSDKVANIVGLSSFLVSHPHMPRKWLEFCLGRWGFIHSFRRPLTRVSGSLVNSRGHYQWPSLAAGPRRQRALVVIVRAAPGSGRHEA